jgi:hypothetical protein
MVIRTEEPDLEQVANDVERLFPDKCWMAGVLDDDMVHLDGVGKADGLA